MIYILSAKHLTLKWDAASTLIIFYKKLRISLKLKGFLRKSKNEAQKFLKFWENLKLKFLKKFLMLNFTLQFLKKFLISFQ